MNTILFPTDFSKNALHAFQYAKMMARTREAKLVLIYTYKLPLAAPVNAFTSREQTLNIIDKDLREAAYARMSTYTKELDLMNGNYSVIIKEGNTINQLVDCCKTEKADLIVMGTKGRSNNREFLMGSITTSLIEKVNTPILAVPESASIQAFKKIVFATDLIHNSIAEIKKAINFAKLNNSSLTFLHVSNDASKVKNELDELEKILAENNSHENLSLEVVNENRIEKGLDNYLKKNETHLLLLSNHTKSFFEKLFHRSVSKEMVLHSKIPLLIFSKEIHSVVFF